MRNRTELQSKLPALVALLNNPNYADTLDDPRLSFELKAIRRRIERLQKRADIVKQKRQNEVSRTG